MSTGHSPPPPSPAPNASNTDAPPHRYTAAYANALELRWQEQWERRGAFRQANPGELDLDGQPFDARKPKFYCLDMFPYPSGAGLHVGHPEGYTATDIMSRYKRMKGFNVLHPMGWDAFGLPAEQYAIQTGVHPAITTRQAIDNFRRQLKRFGFSYDWSREFGTIDPTYYKWTQWVFLQLYNSWFDRDDAAKGSAEPRTSSPTVREGLGPALGRARPIAELVRAFEAETRAVRFNPQATEIAREDRERELGSWATLDAKTKKRVIDSYRLAYLAESIVNWCPKLGTVLANDEVIDGRSERGGHPVLRKPLRQWMFRITAYADRLLEGLKHLDWPPSTRTMQEEWIGRSDGAEVEFPLVFGGPDLRDGPGDAEPNSPSRWTPIPPSMDQKSATAFAVNPAGFVPRDPYPPGQPAPTDLKISIRNLPHLELPDATYFVTWRCAVGRTLQPSDRDLVMETLRHFDGERCRVYAACVMPDHVHWIVRPVAGESIKALCASVKQFSATMVNRAHAQTGSLWQDEAMDHIIRDAMWFGNLLRYVVWNPAEAGLVDAPSAYRWTTLHTDVLARASTQAYPNRPGPEVRATRGHSLRVFTTRPDTIFGATYMVVAPEHPLVDEILAGQGPARRSGPPLQIHLDAADRAKIEAYVKAARNKSEIDRQADTKEKTGVFSGLYCINPATKQRIPIWIADYVLMGYGTGAIMAVPAQDERDWDFAKAFGLPIIRTVQPPADWDESKPFTGNGPAINSAFLDGLSVTDAKHATIEWLEKEGLGTRRVNYKFRDWTFSRQRYWGEPFPIVYDREGNHYPVSAARLPVELPDLADYAPVESDEPQPLLAKAISWVNTTAGEAGVDPSALPPEAPVRRETNTMPGSAGSSWYALRYCDARNDRTLASKTATDYWMGPSIPVLRTSALRADTSSPSSSSFVAALTPTGAMARQQVRSPRESAKEEKESARSADVPSHGGVDLYVGGSEHAVGHLLYSRFWHQVLHDLGYVSAPEPFQKLFHQGLITSFAYQRADKTLVPVDEVWELKYTQDGGGFASLSAPSSQEIAGRVDAAKLPPAIYQALTRDGAAYVTFGDNVDPRNFNGTDPIERVTQITAKMSKSLKNVVNPDDVIAEFGADTFRLYEMYMGPLDASKPWNPRDITGCFRFLQRAWRMLVSEQTGDISLAVEPDQGLERQIHRLTAKVESDIERLAFNTAIAAMIEFVNAATSLSNARQGRAALTADQARRFALVLSPFAPHLAEELWHKLTLILSLHGLAMHAAWPTFDPAMLEDDSVELAVQIQGKVRAKIVVPATADAKAVEAIAMADEGVIKAIEGRPVKKVIVVPKKLVNIVV